MIFKYDDYRSYLKSYIKSSANEGRGLISKWAELIQVSATFMSQALNEKKQLSLEQGYVLAEEIGLSNIEMEYFIYLIQEDRAGNFKLKKFWKSRADKLKKEANKIINKVDPKKVLTEEERSVFYSSALYSAIRLYTDTDSAGKSLKQIAERFHLTLEQAGKFTQFLSDCGLVSYDGFSYKMGHQSTHTEKESSHSKRHHSNWRLKAIDNYEKGTEEDVFYTAPVSLSNSDFILLKEETVKFIQNFLKTVHASPAEEIACLNIDWYKIK